MKYEIKNRWTGSVIFEAELSAEYEKADEGQKLGFALKLALKANANLSGANLRGANLSGADLRDAYLSGANLRGANLSGADLRDAYLSGANLRGAYLRDANLRDANLRGAYLSGANLSDAYLRDANLSGANLSGADLSGAYLSGANLRDANLSGAKDVPDFTMPDGILFSEYLRDVVPALLQAGGKTVKQIVAAGAWECHSWDNCPMAVAFGVEGIEKIPPLYRARAQEFVSFFDAGMIPIPTAEAA